MSGDCGDYGCYGVEMVAWVAGDLTVHEGLSGCLPWFQVRHISNRKE